MDVADRDLSKAAESAGDQHRRGCIVCFRKIVPEFCNFNCKVVLKLSVRHNNEVRDGRVRSGLTVNSPDII